MKKDKKHEILKSNVESLILSYVQDYKDNASMCSVIIKMPVIEVFKKHLRY